MNKTIVTNKFSIQQIFSKHEARYYKGFGKIQTFSDKSIFFKMVGVRFTTQQKKVGGKVGAKAGDIWVISAKKITNLILGKILVLTQFYSKRKTLAFINVIIYCAIIKKVIVNYV